MKELSNRKPNLSDSKGVFAPRVLSGLYQRLHMESSPHGDILVTCTEFPKATQAHVDLACLSKLERALDYFGRDGKLDPINRAFEMMDVVGTDPSSVVRKCVYNLLDKRLGDVGQADILRGELNSLSGRHSDVSAYVESYVADLVTKARANKSHETANELQGKLGTLQLAGYETDRFSRQYSA